MINKNKQNNKKKKIKTSNNNNKNNNLNSLNFKKQIQKIINNLNKYKITINKILKKMMIKKYTYLIIMLIIN